MSTDIITNQISKDMPNSPTATEAVNNTQAAARQSAAAQAGKSLPPEAAPSKEEVQEVVQQINKHVQQINRDLLFSVDDSSGRTVIRVVNSETEEVVRQIPSEEVLRILHNLQEQMDDSTGLIFDTSA